MTHRWGDYYVGDEASLMAEKSNENTEAIDELRKEIRLLRQQMAFHHGLDSDNWPSGRQHINPWEDEE